MRMAKTIRFDSKFRIIVEYSIRFDLKGRNTIRTALNCCHKSASSLQFYCVVEETHSCSDAKQM